jgi:hypothetical protein
MATQENDEMTVITPLTLSDLKQDFTYLCILIERLGGSVVITEAERVRYDRRQILWHSSTIDGHITLELKPPRG